MKYVRFLLLALLVTIVCGTAAAQTTSISIIPRPTHVERTPGAFSLNAATVVSWPKNNDDVAFAADLLIRQLRRVTGHPLRFVDMGALPNTNFILINPMCEDALGDEGYVIEAGLDKILLEANARHGFFYSVQSFLQMLPPEILGTRRVRRRSWEIPCAIIRDVPRFPWRGMHLDVVRHFMPASFIKTYIDMLALHKMNVFHWHLTDDQGWRIEIRRHPRLTSVGAWRVDRGKVHWNARAPQKPGEKARYGGFYTQAEIRDIVRYAAERNITVVPEIEMPAHAMAALAAYPQFSCTGKPLTVPPGGVWPITDIYCAGRDSTFLFLESILAEVLELFPSTYIHIGGDEADKKEWKVCPRCQERIVREGLKDEAGLQSWFVRRIGRFLASKGRRLIGWDEILEGGLAPDAAVMSWRGMDGGIEAARQGHDCVMTPGSHCYLDHYQGRPQYEPPANGGYTPAGRVYAFEPVPDSLTAEQARHILGAQGNVWTEFISTPAHVQYMTLPRMAALAEVVWSPKEGRSWMEFTNRLETQFQRYRTLGWRHASSVYQVDITIGTDQRTREGLVSLANELRGGDIRYTLNGRTPTASSPRYTDPFRVPTSCTIMAATFRNGRPLGAVTQRRVDLHKAAFKTVRYSEPCSPRYDGGGDAALTNTLHGTIDHHDGQWQGFEATDLKAVVDLESTIPVSRIAVSFLEKQASWIFLPRRVEFAVSIDGLTWTPVESQTITATQNAPEPAIREVTCRAGGVRARYIRVYATNITTVPGWHPGSGGKAWLFVDEITVE